MPKNDLSQARRLIKECQETQNPYLELGNCGITDLNDLPELFECMHLETLILSNQWVDWDKLTWNPSKNSGHNNQLEVLPIALSKLHSLKQLILGGEITEIWHISEITHLSGLRNLTYLDLSFNKISQIQNLESLTQLNSLYLCFNQISQIQNLESLAALNSLYLSENQISQIQNLESLTALNGLYLNSNQITQIQNLETLTQLNSLELSGNQITEIQNLETLTQLNSLNLGSNQITEIQNLEALTLLNRLNLNSNQITSIPKEFLERFHLETDLNWSPTGIILGKNPIQTPPLEIVEQGRQAILDWYAAERKELKEIKVILIGDPKAGKTSLLKRLKDDDFDEKEVQTDGINIEDIEFESCGTFKEQKDLHGLTAHFWDFGGQEIMNATHQFFLTNRSVYVVVLDARIDTNSGAQVRKWVRRIKATSGNSPILVVANQIDVNKGFGFENVRELQKEFPEIKGFIKASCKTGEEIETIKNKLAELIPQAELFNTEIDERWIEIKEQLQKETKAEQYLDDKRFIEICEVHQLHDSQQQANAIRFLHDLGIVLHFPAVEAYEYYVLRPYWITYGVYQILTSSKAGDLGGLVPTKELNYIINKEKDKKHSYQPKDFKRLQYKNSERRFLVDVLQQFKLCFYQPDRKKFILPDLLDTAEPTEQTNAVRSFDGNIHFVYDYDYLPKSTLPRIMVENHKNLTEMWRTGCVLEKGNCQAIVSSYQNQLTLTVSGSSPENREFMSILRHEIDQINSSLTEKPDMLIPLPGTEEFADYEELREREKDGEKMYTLYKPVKKKFQISELLQGIAREDEMHRLHYKLNRVLDNQRRQRKGQQSMIAQIDNLDVKADNILSEVQATNLRLEEAIEQLLALPDLAELEEVMQGLWGPASRTGKHNRQLLEAKSSEELQNVYDSLMQFIAGCFEDQQELFDEKLTKIYHDLSKTDNTALKVKVGIPLISLLGISVEGEFDVKNWAKGMQEKYGWEVFQWVERKFS